jgi:hypothetical protein
LHWQSFSTLLFSAKRFSRKCKRSAKRVINNLSAQCGQKCRYRWHAARLGANLHHPHQVHFAGALRRMSA